MSSALSDFDINAWHKAQPRHAAGFQRVNHLKCADGFTMSVQASEGHYCNPSEDNAYPYASFEVGYPNPREPLLDVYAGGDHDGDVYGWVPVDVIHAIVFSHGGLLNE